MSASRRRLLRAESHTGPRGRSGLQRTARVRVPGSPSRGCSTSASERPWSALPSDGRAPWRDPLHLRCRRHIVRGRSDTGNWSSVVRQPYREAPAKGEPGGRNGRLSAVVHLNNRDDSLLPADDGGCGDGGHHPGDGTEDAERLRVLGLHVVDELLPLCRGAGELRPGLVPDLLDLAARVHPPGELVHCAGELLAGALQVGLDLGHSALLRLLGHLETPCLIASTSFITLSLGCGV